MYVEELKKISFIIIQIILGTACSIVLGILTPTIGVPFIILVLQDFKSLGININLVGKPGTIDPEVMILSGLYLLLSILISYYLNFRTLKMCCEP